MLKPGPGRCVVKMNPISRYVESDVVAPNGEKIVKPDDTIEFEELRNNVATVVKIHWRDDDYIWFKEGDRVLIKKVGATKFDLWLDNKLHVFYLLPVEMVDGVFDENDDLVTGDEYALADAAANLDGIEARR